MSAETEDRLGDIIEEDVEEAAQAIQELDWQKPVLVSTSRSPQQGELVKALCKARPKFAEIKKDTKGVYGRYAALDQVLEAVVLPLAAVEIDVSFDVEKVGEDPYIIAKLDHSSGQWRTSRIPLIQGQSRGSSSPMQALGSTVTYGRRYAIQNLLALAPDSDDDNQSQAKQPPKPKIDAAESGKLADEIIGKMTEAQDAAELTAISKAEVTPQVKRLLTPQDLKSITNAFKTLKAGTAGKEK